MKKELHLFIIWKNALDNKDGIITDIKKAFSIRNMFMINWSDKNYSPNLSRFYGTSLPEGSHKELHCGRGNFLLIIVEDNKPVYEERQTSHGPEVVNINMFDKKTLYRDWTGGGHKIHATNNEKEFNHDITLLLGVNKEDFVKKYKPNKDVININQDLPGADTWNNIEEMFYVLNNCIDYVVLRDFENDLSELYNLSYDADLLCKNKEDALWILNGTSDGKVKLKDSECLFDIKYVGDGYYCTAMEEDILKTRKFNNFYYIPEKEYWYMSSLYHALIHKFNFETEYNARLGFLFGKKKHDSSKDKKFFIDRCNDWLKNNNYTIVNYLENPKNFNAENINQFDKKLYADNLFLINKILINKNDEINQVIAEKEEYRNNYEMVINSKGWRLLERLRKFKRIFKK